MADFRPKRQQSGLPADVEDLAQRVIGAAIEVHRHLGPGLPESVYRNALCCELNLRGIAHQMESPLPVIYKGVKVGLGKIDILVDRKLVVELKSIEDLAGVHVAQCVAYLSAGGYQLALLINFNVTTLREGIHRVIRSGVVR